MSKLNIGKKYFHRDAQHGWLAVKRKELVALGLDKEISAFSYQLGKTVYLEEDVDAPKYLKAAAAALGREVETKDAKFWEKSNIRGFSAYTPE